MAANDQQPATPGPDDPTRRVDVAHYRNVHPFSNRLGRGLWGVVWPLLFRTSPRVCHGWRRMLLRLFGAKLGRGVHVYPSTKIWAPWNLRMDEYSCLSADVDCYCVAPVRIGAHATVSQYSYLCTASHDFRQPDMPLITAPIVIEDQAWVCADVFVSMGVTIGQGAVVGARSTVTRDIPPWTVAVGNPARVVKPREMVSRRP